MSKLTPRRLAIYNFIKDTIKVKGYPPTIREIAKAVKLKSPSTVKSYLDDLEKLNLIKRDSTKPRALSIVENKNSTLEKYEALVRDSVFAPVISKITTNNPLAVSENIKDLSLTPSTYFSPDGDYFMMEFLGDSMIDAGIHDSDIILVHLQNDAPTGSIVVTLNNNELKLNTLYKDKFKPLYRLENKTTLTVCRGELRIIGVVQSVFKRSLMLPQ